MEGIVPNGRKITLNFAVANYQVDPEVLSRGVKGVEKTASFRVRMNRTPCITTKNYKSNKGINYLLTCTAL